MRTQRCRTTIPKGNDMIKKLLFVIILITPSYVMGAGTGTLNDPFDSISDLNNGIDSAACGSTLYLLSGIYSSGQTIVLDKLCTEGKELVVSVSNGANEDLGGARITNGTAVISGSYQILKGVHFDSTSDSVTIPGSGASGPGSNHNKITQCKFTNIRDTEGIIIIGNNDYAQNNEVSYCTFEWNDFTYSYGYGIRIRMSVGRFENNTGNYIHHCYFDRMPPSGNYEAIQIGSGATILDFNLWAYTVMEYLWFEDCSPNNELVSIKTSGNTVRFSVVNNHTNGDGAITIRGGESNAIYGCFFYDGVGGNYYDGIRVYDDYNAIFNNYFETVLPGFSNGIFIYSGNNINTVPCTNALIANNTMTGSSRDGVAIDTRDGSILPRNLNIMNNIVESDFDSRATMYQNIGEGHTFSNNLTYCPGPECTDGSSISGVSAMTGYRVTQRHTGLPFNWKYPSSYTNGAANQYITKDIQGADRATTPDIGCDEEGGNNEVIEIGCTWDSGAGNVNMIQYQGMPEIVSPIIGKPDSTSSGSKSGGCFLSTLFGRAVN